MYRTLPLGPWEMQAHQVCLLLGISHAPQGYQPIALRRQTKVALLAAIFWAGQWLQCNCLLVSYSAVPSTRLCQPLWPLCVWLEEGSQNLARTGA